MRSREKRNAWKCQRHGYSAMDRLLLAFVYNICMSLSPSVCFFPRSHREHSQSITMSERFYMRRVCTIDFCFNISHFVASSLFHFRIVEWVKINVPGKTHFCANIPICFFSNCKFFQLPISPRLPFITGRFRLFDKQVLGLRGNTLDFMFTFCRYKIAAVAESMNSKAYLLGVKFIRSAVYEQPVPQRWHV